MFKYTIMFAAVAGLVLALAPAAQAGTLSLIDLGDSGGTGVGGTPPSPDGNGNYWNQLAKPQPPSNIANLQDSTGSLTGWGAAASGGNGDSGWVLVVAPAPFDIPEVYSDNHISGGGGGAGHQPLVYNFTGLNSSLPYDFTLWGERDSAGYGLPSPHDPTDWANGDIQVTTGTAVGGPSFTLLQSTLLTMTITPDGAGKVDFTADWSATTGGNWLQIGVVSIEEVPEPASAALLLLGLPFVMRRKRR